MQAPNYEILTRQFTDEERTMNGAEAQGILLGMICALGTPSFTDFCTEVFAEDPSKAVSAKLQRDLALLHVCTVKQLNDDELELQLTLPEDSATLMLRSQALADCARGLLYGLSAGGIDRNLSMSEDARGIIADLSELSQGAADEANDEAESALAELIEYLRLAVWMLRTEFAYLHSVTSAARH